MTNLPSINSYFPRRFVQITRTIDPDTLCHTIDAIDDDGRAWCMIVGDEQWNELLPLPSRQDHP